MAYSIAAQTHALEELKGLKKIISQYDDIVFGSRVTLTTFDKIESNIRVLYTQDHDLFSQWKELSIIIKNTDIKNYDDIGLYELHRNKIIRDVRALIRKIESDQQYLKMPEKQEGDKPAFQKALNVCRKFGKVARFLKNMDGYNRTPFLIKNEYDVQALLHALMLVDFDDVRSEEGTASTMGKNSRIDFLLKNEKIIIECKITRNGRTDKFIGQELLDDIPRYRCHVDCEYLIFLVYDPDGYIQNEAGLSHDLAINSFDLKTDLVVVR